MSGALQPSEEVLLESVILFGRDGSLLKLPPDVSHVADATVSGLLGGLALDPIGPKAVPYYLFPRLWNFATCTLHFVCPFYSRNACHLLPLELCTRTVIL